MKTILNKNNEKTVVLESLEDLETYIKQCNENILKEDFSNEDENVRCCSTEIAQKYAEWLLLKKLYEYNPEKDLSNGDN